MTMLYGLQGQFGVFQYNKEYSNFSHLPVLVYSFDLQSVAAAEILPCRRTCVINLFLLWRIYLNETVVILA